MRNQVCFLKCWKRDSASAAALGDMMRSNSCLTGLKVCPNTPCRETFIFQQKKRQRRGMPVQSPRHSIYMIVDCCPVFRKSQTEQQDYKQLVGLTPKALQKTGTLQPTRHATLPVIDIECRSLCTAVLHGTPKLSIYIPSCGAYMPKGPTK